MGVENIRFTQSARRHKVGRARALYVIAHPLATVVQVRPGKDDMRILLGEDETGRLIEVGVVVEGDHLLVIHVMDMRAKFRTYLEGT